MLVGVLACFVLIALTPADSVSSLQPVPPPPASLEPDLLPASWARQATG